MAGDDEQKLRGGQEVSRETPRLWHQHFNTAEKSVRRIRAPSEEVCESEEKLLFLTTGFERYG